MTMRVNGPGGLVVSFPDGTDKETINRVMAEALNKVEAQARIAQEREGQGPDGAWYQQLDDSARAFASGVPLIGGAMDEISAGLNTGFGYLGDYDKELAYQRERDRQFAERHPVASIANQIAGGVGAGVGAARRLPIIAIPGGLGGKVAAGGAVGGGLGYEEGFTRGEGSAVSRHERGKDAAIWGAGLGAATPMLAASVGKAVSKFAGKPASTPTTEAIRAQKTQAYETAKQSGLVMKPEAVDRMAASTIKEAMDDGLDADLTPKAFTLYKRLDELRAQAFKGGDGISLNEIENLRKKAVRVVQGPDRAEAHFAGELIGKIDDFLESASPNDVISGDPMQAASQLNTARGLAKQQVKAELIDEALRRADIAAQSNYTQAGIHQAIKREFANIAKNKRFKKNFSPEEQAAIMDVVNGGGVENFFRRIGMMAPSGGLSQMLHLGGALQSGGATIPLSIGASGAQYGAARSGISRAGQAEALIKGGPQMGGRMSPAALAAERRIRSLLLPQTGLIGAAADRQFSGY